MTRLDSDRITSLRELAVEDGGATREELFERAALGARGRITRGRRVRRMSASAAVLLAIIGAFYSGSLITTDDAGQVAMPIEPTPSPRRTWSERFTVHRAASASLAGRAIEGATIEGHRLVLTVGHGGELAFESSRGDRLELSSDTEVAVDAAERIGVDLRRGSVLLDGHFRVTAPSCACELDGQARVEVTAVDDGFLRTHVSVIAGDMSASPGSSCITPMTVLELPSPDLEGGEVERPEPRRRSPDPIPNQTSEQEHAEAMLAPGESALLAERVDRLAEAQALMRRNPEHALHVLEQLSSEWPDAPVREELDASIAEALIFSGQGERARRAAERLVSRYGESRYRELLERAESLP